MSSNELTPGIFPFSHLRRRMILWGGVAMVGALGVLAYPRLVKLPGVSEGEGVSAPQTYSREIQYGYTLRNTGDRLRSGVVLWTYAPVTQAAFQKTERIGANVPYKLSQDALGNRVLELEIGSIPPFGTSMVELSVTLSSSAEARFQPPGVLDRYLQAEPQIESDHPDIIAITSPFLEQSPAKTAHALFDWVVANLRPEGYRSRSRGALEALNTRTGDCTEFAQLYAALARAAGIPTRVVAGYRMPEGGRLHPDDLHNWAEVRLDQTWRVVDPHARRFLEDEYDYIAMTVLGRPTQQPLGGHKRFYVTDAKVSVEMN